MRKGETAAALAGIAVLFSLATVDDLRDARLVDPPNARGGRARPRAIDLNRDPWWRLASLPGIGPIGAKRIVAYRHGTGPFGSLEALRAVPGIRADVPARIRGRAFAGPIRGKGDDGRGEPIPIARAVSPEG